jgi:hypothetical protein
LINWCDLQQTETGKIIDDLLDQSNWRKPKNKKALQLAGEILENIDLLRAEALQDILPRNQQT